MPTYCYTCPACRESFELFAPVAEFRRERPCACGEKAFIDLAKQQLRQRSGEGKWPMLSEAAAVDAEQVPYMQKYLAERGIRTEYVADEAGAKPLFTSARHRKLHCEAIGLHDLNGGYGDPQKK